MRYLQALVLYLYIALLLTLLVRSCLFQALSITQIVFGWVGVAVIIFVLIPFFLNFSDALNYGSFLSLYVMIPTLMVSVALVWPSFFGSYKNVICQKDSIKLADTSSFPCAIQGTLMKLTTPPINYSTHVIRGYKPGSLLYWGASSMVVWWVIVCFHLMVGAFYGVIGYSNPVLSKIYHSLGWVNRPLLRLEFSYPSQHLAIVIIRLFCITVGVAQHRLVYIVDSTPRLSKRWLYQLLRWYG